MAIVFQCKCGNNVLADASLAGRQTTCQSCQALLTVPQAPLEAPLEAPSDPMEAIAVEPLDPSADDAFGNQEIPSNFSDPMMAVPVDNSGGLAIEYAKPPAGKKAKTIAGIAAAIGIFFIIFVVAAVIGFPDLNQKKSAAKLQKAISVEEARAFAKKFSITITTKTAAQVNQLIDWEELFRRSAEGIKLSSKDSRDFFAGVKNAMTMDTGVASQLSQSVRIGGQYKLIRIGDENGKPVPLFRLLSPEGGVNYHKLRLHRDAAGQIRIADIHVAMSGENLSQTLRRNLISMAASRNRSLWEKLTSDEVDIVKHEKKFAAMAAAMNGNPARVIEIYNDLPLSLKKQKNVQMMRLAAASQLDNMDVYIESINDFRRFHPDDPAADIVSMDLFVVNEEYDKAFAAIERVQASLGGDPFMTALTSKLHFDSGRPEEARKLAEKALKEEPDLHMGHFVNVCLAFLENDNDAVLSQLKKTIASDPPIALEDFADMEFYNSFLSSPQFREWQKFKQEKSKDK